jgi:caa(3)-type oxidase subunit IV
MTAEHAQAGQAHAAHAYPHPNYVKIWAILCVLLVVSIIGPMVGVVWITLVTAFGIAVVKALMVAAYFMHLNIERLYVKQLLLIILTLMLLLFAGVAPDVMKKAGRNWEHQPIKAPAAPARH